MREVNEQPHQPEHNQFPVRSYPFSSGVWSCTRTVFATSCTTSRIRSCIWELTWSTSSKRSCCDLEKGREEREWGQGSALTGDIFLKVWLGSLKTHTLACDEQRVEEKSVLGKRGSRPNGTCIFCSMELKSTPEPSAWWGRISTGTDACTQDTQWVQREENVATERHGQSYRRQCLHDDHLAVTRVRSFPSRLLPCFTQLQEQKKRFLSVESGDSSSNLCPLSSMLPTSSAI